MIKIAFAGFRHPHILALYDAVKQSDLVQLQGAFEEDAETRAQMEKDKGIVFNYDTYAALLADPSVDAVAIGDYYSIRGSRVIEALKAGKHVIADKPLCTEESEAKEIRRLCEEKNLAVYLMLDLRFDPSFFTAKKLIESGAVGEIAQIAFQGQHPLLYNERARWYFEEGKHGGVINDIAIHGIDLLTYLCDLEIEKINAARCWNAYATEEKDFKDSAQFMLTAKNGAGVIADVSYAIPDGVEFALPYYWQFYLWGEKGTISFSLNGEAALFEKENKEKQILENKPAVNYLTDFHRLVNGGKDVVLPMEEVFGSTRLTLLTQSAADGE